MYKCPICQSTLSRKESTYRCINNHSFDISRFNYVNLYRSNSKDHGDNNELVLARTAFLRKHFYKPLQDTLTNLISELKPTTIIDLGCGEGYYTNAFIAPEVYGFDLSRKAIETAARASKQLTTHYAVASIFDIPILDQFADLATIIFAPLPKAELERVIKKGGYLIEVTPDTHHLFEMKEVLYPEVILNSPSIHSDYKLVKSIPLCYTIDLENSDIHNLFKMTPYCYKTSIEASNKLLALPSLTTTISFLIHLYQF